MEEDDWEADAAERAARHKDPSRPKLEDLRASKKQRDEALRAAGGDPDALFSTFGFISAEQKKREVAELLKELNTDLRHSSRPRRAHKPLPPPLEQPERTLETRDEIQANSPRARELPLVVSAEYTTTATQTTTEARTSTTLDESTQAQLAGQDSDIPFTVSEEQSVPATRPEVVTYSVGVQTSQPWPSPQEERAFADLSDSEPDGSPSKQRTPRARRRQDQWQREKEEELRENLRLEIQQELEALTKPGQSLAVIEGQSRYPLRALNDEEMTALISSDELIDFVDRSSKVIEKALEEDYDVLADYSMAGFEGLEEDEDEGYASSKGRKGRRLREAARFYDERWDKKRMISDIHFSPKFPELLLAAYTKNPSAPQDPTGLVHVWNLHLQSRPEYTFHSTSDVLTARFSPFHPSYILGGTYTGQVLLWDTRSKNPMPVQKTPLTGSSAGGHTHPIYSIEVVGTQNANNIMSCSTDGVICGWTFDMLSQPQEYLELMAPPPNKTEDVSPTCMAFPPSDPTSFLVGTEEGAMYACHRYDRAGAKAGIDTRMRYRGHVAPIMSLDFHSSRGPVDLSDLALTSSLDWTVKLWKTRSPAATSGTATAGTASSGYAKSLPGVSSAGTDVQEVHPILEFVREEVVYDARWSPHRPAVFALVDGAGSVEVWDLLADLEVPVAKASPSNKGLGMSGLYVPKSLNKLAWDEKEGKRLAVGGAAGLLTVFEVGSDLSGERGVKGEEYAEVKKLIGRIGRGLR